MQMLVHHFLLVLFSFVFRFISMYVIQSTDACFHLFSDGLEIKIQINAENIKKRFIFLSLTLSFSAIWHISRLQTAVMAICSLKIFSRYVVYKTLWWGGLRSGTYPRHYPSQQSWVPFTKSRATTPPEVHPITTISLHYPYHVSLSVQWCFSSASLWLSDSQS